MVSGGVLGIALGLTVLVAGLALATHVKTRSAYSVFSRVVGTMEKSARRIGVFAVIPGLATLLWMLRRGVEPLAAFVVGALVAFGMFALSLSILRMEGILTESESDASLRIGQGSAAPSTSIGRVMWGIVGIILLGVGLFTIHLVS